MTHAFLKRLSTWTFGGRHWEIDYTFTPSEKLRGLLASLPSPAHIFFEVRPDGSMECRLIEDDPPGWRIRVGNGAVYALVDPPPMPPEAAAALASGVHTRMLESRLYYSDRDDHLEYWRKPDDEFNRAEDYASADLLVRSAFLAQLIQTHCPATKSAIEVGCNVGRNLDHLHEHLGLEVAGFEISGHALALLKQTYPGLADIALYQGDVLERITELADARYDLVFSMAVLMHIHPDTAPALWKHLHRVAARNIITIENETTSSDRNWARNYKDVFEPLGATQLHTEIATVAGLEGYTIRVFSVVR